MSFGKTKRWLRNHVQGRPEAGSSELSSSALLTPGAGEEAVEVGGVKR